MKRWQKIVLWLITGFVLLLIISLSLLPTLAENYIEKNDLDLLGREIEIEDIDLNYFTGLLEIEGFTMSEADPRETFISFDLLSADLAISDFFKKSVFVESLRLHGLYAQVVQRDSTFNFDDLMASSSADTLSSEPKGDRRR
jgi:uncharacterized protein involved in outer membrane biogenesis